MVRMLLAFVVVFLLFYIGIDTFRRMTGKEKWALTKTLIYSIMCAGLTIAVLISMVILF